MIVDDWRGFDTETQDGKAVLLGTDLATLSFPRSLLQTYRWLRAQGERFVAWNVDYDARAVLWLVPRNRWQELADRNGCVWQGLNVRYLPHKVFRIWRKGVSHSAIEIYDAQQFLGGSLERASQQHLGAGKLDIPRSWYSRIGDLLRAGGWRADRIRRYCERDAGLALQLWRRVHASYQSAGFPSGRPLSPAYIAGQVALGGLREHRLPAWAERAFEKSFYGGRFELWKRGKVNGWRTHDLHSAYPAAMARARLPRGRCRVTRDGPGASTLYGAYRVAVDVPPDDPAPPFPLRGSGGTLWFPQGRFVTWTDAETLRDPRARSYVLRVLWGVEIVARESVPLLWPDIGRWYRLRKDPAMGLAMKLTMNGLYGRTAMRLPRWEQADRWRAGARWENGRLKVRVRRSTPTTNFALAAYITAACRRRLLQAARLAPERVVALAADAVYWRGRGAVPGLVTGPGLGQWDSGKTGPAAVFVQPGVYSLGHDDGTWEDRQRGFPLTQPLRQVLDTPRRRVSAWVLWADTLALALKTDPSRMNVLRPVRKLMDIDQDERRYWAENMPGGARGYLEHLQESEPNVVWPTRGPLAWPKAMR